MAKKDKTKNKKTNKKKVEEEVKVTDINTKWEFLAYALKNIWKLVIVMILFILFFFSGKITTSCITIDKNPPKIKSILEKGATESVSVPE